MKYRPIPSYQIFKKMFSVKSSSTDKLEPEAAMKMIGIMCRNNGEFIKQMVLLSSSASFRYITLRSLTVIVPSVDDPL